MCPTSVPTLSWWVGIQVSSSTLHLPAGFSKKAEMLHWTFNVFEKKQIPMILATMNIDQRLLETPLIGIWTLKFLGWRWVKFSLKIDDFSRENWNLHHVLATGWFGLMGFHFKSQDGDLTFP